MDTLTEAQAKVHKAVIYRLAYERQIPISCVSVCMDKFPSDEECKKDFDRSVENVVMETKYWEEIR